MSILTPIAAAWLLGIPLSSKIEITRGEWGDSGLRARRRSFPCGARPLIRSPMISGLGAVETIRAAPPSLCNASECFSLLASMYSIAPRSLANFSFDPLLDRATTLKPILAAYWRAR